MYNFASKSLPSLQQVLSHNYCKAVLAQLSDCLIPLVQQVWLLPEVTSVLGSLSQKQSNPPYDNT